MKLGVDRIYVANKRVVLIAPIHTELVNGYRLYDEDILYLELSPEVLKSIVRASEEIVED